MPLSELNVRTAKPKDKPYKLTDSEGLQVLVQPNGSRLWQMRYRFAGKEKLLSFGRYPDVSLAAARQRRHEARQLLAAGSDPGMQKKLEKIAAGNTFEAIARMWHENRKSALVGAHEQRVLARMERDVFPVIGSRPIAEIDSPEILELVRKIEARGALDISRRARQMIGQVYRFAIALGLVTRDPSAGLTAALRPRPRVQHMAKLSMNDMGDFLAKIHAAGDCEPVTRLAMMFTLQTWGRTSEIRFATWSDFEQLDGTEPLWRIPKERMKMHREHLVPLSRQAVAVLLEARTLGGKEYVFPAPRAPANPISQNTLIFALYRAGFHSRATVHGLRGTASTWANESGKFNRDWVELALAHNDEDEVRSAYNAAEYLPQRRAMLQEWSDVLEASLMFGRMLG